MKLNLLPTHVSKASSARSSGIIGILIFVVLALGAVFLFIKGKNDLEASRDGLSELKGRAEMAKATADKADVVMANATGILRNIYLAEAMLKHSQAYPTAYSSLRPYIPSFYRVTSMTATPVAKDLSQVTIVGTLDSYQQYADLMLALLRNPKVMTVTRQGFNQNSAIVPGLSETDQYGKPLKPGATPIPDNWEDRLRYFESNAKSTGYLGVGGYGSGVVGLRGPMPDASQVTVQVTLATDLQTPDPLATLKAGQGAPAPGGNRNAPAANQLPVNNPGSER